MQMTIQGLFQQTARDWVNEARHEAQKLLMKMDRITIEDVLIVCPRPQYLHPNITGTVFQSNVFKHIGFTISRRSTSNGRVIRVWGLREELYPPLDRKFRDLKDFEND